MTSNLYDNLVARVAELYITLENIQRQIQEAEEEKQRMMSNPSEFQVLTQHFINLG